MEIFIISISVMAVLHFAYDGIVLPSLRLHLRNKLFEVRDQVRNLKISGVSSEDENAFWFVHDGINRFLTKLPQLTLMRTVQLRLEYESNKKLQEQARERLQIVKDCENEEIKEVFVKTNNVIEMAIIANMGGWFFYMIPIVVLVAGISKLSVLVSELIVTPAYEANKLFEKRGIA